MRARPDAAQWLGPEWVALTAIFALSTPRVAAAETLRFDWVRVDKEAQSGCPASEAVEFDVRRRLFRGVPEARVEGSVRRRNSAWEAAIHVVREDGQSVRRTIESEDRSCEAVVQAAAVAISILLDPEAERRPVVPEGPAEIVEEPSSVDGVGRVGLAVGLSALAHGGTLPAAGLGVRLDARWKFANPWTLSLGAAFLPEMTDAPFAFSLTSGFVGVGVEHTAIGIRWGAALHAHLGAMSAFALPSESFSPAEPGTHLWAALSLEGRAGLSLPGGWSIEAFGGPLLALIRRPFVVRDQPEPTFKESLVGFRAGLSVVVRFRE